MGARFVRNGALQSRALRVWCCAALWLVSAPGQADRVHLAGGSVIEGKVSYEGDKIVIALDSGSVRLDAKSVVRIEKGETAADRIAAQRATLPKTALAERIALANRCRDESLVQCERELLREVLVLDPEHAEARARLGYVHGEHGWLTREEQHRLEQAEQARQRREAESTSAVRVAELARDAAELARQQAELSLESQRVALRAAEAERQKAQVSPRYGATWPMWGASPYLYSPRRPPTFVLTPPQHAGPAFGINGVRDPASYFR
jgi:hypothetical protein